jgi:hypothetical protein
LYVPRGTSDIVNSSIQLLYNFKTIKTMITDNAVETLKGLETDLNATNAAIQALEKAKIPVPTELTEKVERIQKQMAELQHDANFPECRDELTNVLKAYTGKHARTLNMGFTVTKDAMAEDAIVTEIRQKALAVIGKHKGKLEGARINVELVNEEGNQALRVTLDKGKKASKPSSGTGEGNKGGGKGREVTVEGKTYESAAEACRQLGIEVGTDNAHRKLRSRYTEQSEGVFVKKAS